MREFKFRAWDTVDKCWMYGYETLGGFSLIGEVTLMGELGRPKLEKLLTDIVFMQYSGLKDKNGKEIYEGDILELVNESMETIRVECRWGIHKRDMPSGFVVDIPSFAFINQTFIIGEFPSFPIVNNYLGKHDLEIMEVIGNIYENPELLN